MAHARGVLAEVSAIERAADIVASEIRVGYAWSALGRHTTSVQRRCAVDHPGSALVFVQSHTTLAGLGNGTADVAVLRRPVDDRRISVLAVGTERRYAAVASDDSLARRRSVLLTDVDGRTIAIDEVTGTTTSDLWQDGSGPSRTRSIHGVDEWLTLIAAGQAVGMTSEATARQHPRPSVAYRPVRDAEPIRVLVAWRTDDPPPLLSAFTGPVRDAYDDDVD